jgi:GxxExxY protein
VGDIRLDLILHYCVIVECKADEKIHPKHRAQLRQYLAATGIEVGLLLNFGPKPTFARIYHPNEGREHREVQFHRRGI